MHSRPEHKRTLRRFTYPLIMIVFLSLGCEGGIGGLGADRLEVRRCGDEILGGSVRCHAEDETAVFEPFAMPIRFLGLVVVDNKGFIRMSPLDRTVVEGDQALVVIHDVAALRESMSNGQSGTIALDGPEAGAEVTLVLMERCECPHDPLVATSGTLTFTAFGTTPGTDVAGTLSEVVLTNMRTGATVATDFHGSFDFAVVTTTPWQPFSNLPAHR